MNSINWPAPSVWVFIAQLVKYCSANAEATGSNPIKFQKNFFGATSQLLKLRFNLSYHKIGSLLINILEFEPVCFTYVIMLLMPEKKNLSFAGV